MLTLLYTLYMSICLKYVPRIYLRYIYHHCNVKEPMNSASLLGSLIPTRLAGPHGLHYPPGCQSRGLCVRGGRDVKGKHEKSWDIKSNPEPPWICEFRNPIIQPCHSLAPGLWLHRGLLRRCLGKQVYVRQWNPNRFIWSSKGPTYLWKTKLYGLADWCRICVLLLHVFFLSLPSRMLIYHMIFFLAQ